MKNIIKSMITAYFIISFLTWDLNISNWGNAYRTLDIFIIIIIAFYLELTEEL